MPANITSTQDYKLVKRCIEASPAEWAKLARRLIAARCAEETRQLQDDCIRRLIDEIRLLRQQINMAKATNKMLTTRLSACKMGSYADAGIDSQPAKGHNMNWASRPYRPNKGTTLRKE